MSLEREMAFRYMRAKRKENFISLITVISVGGVALGVAALIVVLAVLAGFETNLKNRFLNITSHVVVMNLGGGIRDWPELVDKIKTIDGVKSAEPYVYGQVLAMGPSGPSGAMVKGVDPQLAAEGQLGNLGLSLGAQEHFLNPDENLTFPPIILGRELSVQLGVYTYDLIKAISPFGRVTPLGGRSPLTKEFQVAGTFHSGLFEYDANLLYMSLASAQELMAMGDEVSTIEVQVEDVYKADVISQEIVNLIGPDEFWARDWMQMNLNLFAALKLEQTAMFVVLTLIIVVAAFNIVAALVMMVMEKKKDIAILKSMGATKRQIRNIFTIQGLTVGVVGAAGGLVVGLIICLLLKQYKFIKLPSELYMMDSLPIEIRPLQVVAILAVTIIISYLATIYPSKQAAAMDPVEALRYE